MNVWSKGLGQRSLNLKLGDGEVRTESNQLFVEGMIEEPVWWEYRITLGVEDVTDIANIIGRGQTIRFILGSGRTGEVLLAFVKAITRVLWTLLLPEL